MSKQINNIVIVGGGTSGWMAACYLQRMLNNKVAISVIEGKDGPIGVGEATIPTLRNMLIILGIDEREFMIETDATFKMAIRFENWTHNPAVKPDYYYHAFDRPGPISGLDAGASILATHKNLTAQGFADLISVQPALCDRLRTPKLHDSKPYEAPTGYAYHLDAIKFGHFLRKIAVSRGVQRIVDHVDDVVLNELGYISSLKTSSGQIVEGDFYLDCTGFQALLIDKTYNIPFTPWNQQLYCDRAIAFQVPSQPNSSIKPYTISTAVNNGWIWEVALRERKGIGYVYSSQFVTDNEAERELRQHIGPQANDLSPRQLKMRVGRHKVFWHKNCIAIGLSAGFLEPLESTGIYLTEMGLKHFMENYPSNGFDEVLSDHYNEQMAKLYDETLNFIVLHYCLTKRDDTDFWKANKYHQNIPPELKRDLQLWQHRLPSSWDKSRPGQFFTVESYHYILAGMRNGELPGSSIDCLVSSKEVNEYVAHITKTKRMAVAMSPDHGRFIRAMNRHK